MLARFREDASAPQRVALRWFLRSMLGVISLLVLLCLPGYLHPAASTPAMGKGAGGVAQVATTAQDSDPCMTGDAGQRLSQSVFSWIATNVQQSLTPITDEVLKSPIDIVYQTPAQDTYELDAIKRINTALVLAVDAALATLVLIGGLNLMIGSQLNMSNVSAMELLARLVLVVGLVHFNLYFLGQFIELNNALCLEIDHIAGISELANLLAGVFTNSAGTVLAFLLMIVISFFLIWLLVQMVVRIGLVAVCLAMAPLGLGCLLLPQTLRWGRLWLTTFAASVMVQLVQVAALSLGGVLITQLATTSLVRLDKGIATCLLIIGVLFLVNKIPLMLQQWALYPLMQAGKGLKGGGSQGGGDGSSSAGGTGGDGSGGGEAPGGGSAGGTGVTGGGNGGISMALDDPASMPALSTMGSEALGAFLI